MHKYIYIAIRTVEKIKCLVIKNSRENSLDFGWEENAVSVEVKPGGDRSDLKKIASGTDQKSKGK